MNSCITWWEEDKLTSFIINKKGTIEKIFPTDKVISSIPSTVLALPADIFSRRTHPRPFKQKSKLKRILPAMMDGVLIKASPEDSTTLLVSSALAANRFTTFTVPNNKLNAIVKNTTANISPILQAVPAPLGLKYFAKGGSSSIIITPNENNGVTAVLFDKNNEMVDFRSSNNWEKEALLTISNWYELFPDAIVFTTKEDIIPAEISCKLIKLPKNINTTNASFYGLFMMNQKGQNLQPTLRINDPVTIIKWNKFTKKLLIPLSILFMASIIATSHQIIKQQNITQNITAIDNTIAEVFSNTMPNTPLVDAPLQMSRRANELALLTGSSLRDIISLPEQLINLQKQIINNNLAITLNELAITQNSLRLVGSLNELSEVDTLQSILQKLMPESEVTLRNVQLSNNKEVSFQLDAQEIKE